MTTLPFKVGKAIAHITIPDGVDTLSIPWPNASQPESIHTVFIRRDLDGRAYRFIVTKVTTYPEWVQDGDVTSMRIDGSWWVAKKKETLCITK